MSVCVSVCLSVCVKYLLVTTVAVPIYSLQSPSLWLKLPKAELVTDNMLETGRAGNLLKCFIICLVMLTMATTMILGKENRVKGKKTHRKWEEGKTYKDTRKQKEDIEGTSFVWNSYFMLKSIYR